MLRSMVGWVLVLAVVAACESGTGPDTPDLVVPAVTLAARGDTARLTALAHGVAAAASWRSLDSAVVTVSEDGLASAVAGGTARVRATFGGVAATGEVRVLPPVDVRVSELTVVTDVTGEQGVRMRIRNLGGRGYFAPEYWKLDPDGTRRRIVWYASAQEAEPGLDVVHTNYLGEEIADWVVVYSREPVADEPVRTACARIDGAAGCPSELPGLPTVHSVLITPAAAVLEVGDSVLYHAHAFDASGTEVAGRAVAWSTPSPAIIHLDERGMATALTPGYGEVRATIEGIEAAVGLTVTESALPASIPCGSVRKRSPWTAGTRCGTPRGRSMGTGWN
jgi:hypothetical protein